MGKNYLKNIKIKSLKVINLPEGNIVRILKKNELKNWTFNEAYFSKIKFGKIKAWKFHLKMTLNLVVPCGKVKFVFYSEKNKIFKVIKIGENQNLRLIVPPKIWFGFKGLSRNESIILNLTNTKHDSKEILRRKISNIKFNW